MDSYGSYRQITSAQFGRASPLFFSSPLSFFLNFWCNFWTQMRREWRLGLYRVGDRPLSLVGGATGPPPSTHPRPGTSLQIQKKYIKFMSPVAWAIGPLSPAPGAAGGHFQNFSKRAYIFEIFIFLNIKKKKAQAWQLSFVVRSGFFIFILKKTKFQKYMSNRKIFKNGCLSPIQLATGPKCKNNFTFRS